jgi:hypothetical protein
MAGAGAAVIGAGTGAESVGRPDDGGSVDGAVPAVRWRST